MVEKDVLELGFLQGCHGSQIDAIGERLIGGCKHREGPGP